MILSVVVPTHNKLPLLRRTLTALGRQEPGPGRTWEVVVVDDGSSDGTAAWLASEAPALVPGLRVETPPRNVGRARARNLGARAARGRWLLFLDDDIVAPPGLLAAHLDVLAARPDAATIGWAATAEEVRDGAHFHYLDTRGVARLPEGPAPARYFVTQNAAVPRAAFLAVGGFDEGFAAYGFEDMEVAFRLEDGAGIRFRALPRPVPRHVHHHSLDAYLDKKIEAGGASLRRLAVRHPHRMAEMRLEAVVGGGGALGALVRAAANGPVTGLLRHLLASWPTDAGHRPYGAPLYRAAMGFAVLCCLRQGWRASGNPARTAE